MSPRVCQLLLSPIGLRRSDACVATIPTAAQRLLNARDRRHVASGESDRRPRFRLLIRRHRRLLGTIAVDGSDRATVRRPTMPIAWKRSYATCKAGQARSRRQGSAACRSPASTTPKGTASSRDRTSMLVAPSTDLAYRVGHAVRHVVGSASPLVYAPATRTRRVTELLGIGVELIRRLVMIFTVLSHWRSMTRLTSLAAVSRRSDWTACA